VSVVVVGATFDTEPDQFVACCNETYATLVADVARVDRADVTLTVAPGSTSVNATVSSEENATTALDTHSRLSDGLLQAIRSSNTALVNLTFVGNLTFDVTTRIVFTTDESSVSPTNASVDTPPAPPAPPAPSSDDDEPSMWTAFLVVLTLGALVVAVVLACGPSETRAPPKARLLSEARQPASDGGPPLTDEPNAARSSRSGAHAQRVGLSLVSLLIPPTEKRDAD
jgi:hypothetical protein